VNLRFARIERQPDQIGLLQQNTFEFVRNHMGICLNFNAQPELPPEFHNLSQITTQRRVTPGKCDSFNSARSQYPE
jgi:hypothetical protein